MDSFGKCDQIRRKLLIWSHLPKKSLMETLIYCALTSFDYSCNSALFLHKIAYASNLAEYSFDLCFTTIASTKDCSIAALLDLIMFLGQSPLDNCPPPGQLPHGQLPRKTIRMIFWDFLTF